MFGGLEALKLVIPWKKLSIFSGQQYVMCFFIGSKRLKCMLHFGHARGNGVPFFVGVVTALVPLVGAFCGTVVCCLACEDNGLDNVVDAGAGLLSAIFSLVLGFFGETLVKSTGGGLFSINVFSFRPTFAAAFCINILCWDF